MRKVFFLLAAALMAVSVMAQEPLRCFGNSYYYGSQKIEESQLLDFYAQQNCQAAYDQYAQGQRMVKAGWALLGVGAALDLGATVSACLYICGELDLITADTNGGRRMRAQTAEASFDREGAFIAMLALGAGASVFEMACVPLLVVGYHKKHDSVDVYNVINTTAKVQPYWAIQASQNGLGLALKF